MTTQARAHEIAISPYVPRPIQFLGLWRAEGWRVKVYGIAYGRPAPAPECVESAKRLAQSVLPAHGAYGVGFVGVHAARTGLYVFVDWWANENELFHRPFLGPSHDELRPAGPDDSTACVWDLAVIEFERRSWHELVVKRPESPDIEGYLAQRLQALV